MPDVEMTELASRARQEDWVAGVLKPLDLIGAHLPDLACG
jgi:hypothetical protein